MNPDCYTLIHEYLFGSETEYTLYYLFNPKLTSLSLIVHRFGPFVSSLKVEEKNGQSEVQFRVKREYFRHVRDTAYGMGLQRV